MKKRSTVELVYMSMLALAGLAALILQYGLMIVNRNPDVSLARTTVAFLSYFTILTNMLVTISLIVPLLKPGCKGARFFSRPAVITSVAGYITLVALIYALLLRHLWHPTGLQWLADELLHSVIPAGYVLYWLIFVPKGTLKWTLIFPWLLYPLAYFIYTLLRGFIAGVYPYPFIDVNTLGYGAVLLNAVMVLAVSCLIVFFFLALDHLMRKRG